MDQGYKHFSHLHNLVMHEMPEGIDVSCSGCHSSATGTVYVCWSCNFFLHEQCYQATRSLKHPSHPPHPLTLVPYPTYHSNSFYCNSCQIIGTGFSYSCADCEFDLHVQCAYSIARATSFKNAHQFQELLPSGWNGMQNSNIDHHHVPFVSAPESLSIPFIGVQNHYIPTSSVSGTQYHSASLDLASVSTLPQSQISTQEPTMAHNLASVSIPMSIQNPLANAKYSSMDQIGSSVSFPTNYPPNTDPSSQDPSMTQDRPSVSISTSSQSRISSAQHPSMTQTGASVSAPTNPPSQFTNFQGPSVSPNEPSDSIPTSTGYPSISQTEPFVSIPTIYPQNPIPKSQDPQTTQTGSSVSIPTSSLNSSAQYPSVGQTGASVSIPTNNPQNPIPRTQDPPTPQTKPSIPTSSQNSSVQYPSIPQTGPSVSIPTNYPQNPIHRAHDNPTPQTAASVSIPTSSHDSSTQYPPIPPTRPSVSIPTNPSDAITSSHDPLTPQNRSKDHKIVHFSHPHSLSKVTLQEDEEDEIICSGCEETLVGNGYSCIKPDCNFHLHESCFHLRKEINHKSHLEHPLTLLPHAPYNNKDGEFTCSACFSDGTGFTYHCSICQFDLHVQCVSLPEKVKRDDHEHMLKLLYSCPVKYEGYAFSCDVCHGEIQKDRWAYYCESCDYGTHLGCVDCEECERDSILDTQAQLQRLQLQMEMARQQAQFISSMGSSLANLAG